MATSFLPQYPLGDEPQPAQPAVNVPSEMSFAQEVRMTRLGILWRITLFGALVVIWSMIVLRGDAHVPLINLLIPSLIITVGCLMTGYFLRHMQLNPAVWVYALGATGALGYAMSYGGDFAERYIAFMFPLLVFVVGLLLPMRDTLTLTLVVSGTMLTLPSVARSKVVVAEPTVFALFLTALAAALSAQVSGELFAIAEWALENYRKERRTTFALFESREALQKSLHRQRALTQQLQETNEQLEAARAAAEEAKTFRGQFLANMSHELRTPLNAIIGFSQTMLDFPAMYDGVELPTQYRQDMNQILSSGKHLLTIINDILDLSKVDAGKLDLDIQPVDLAPIVKGVLSTAVGLVGDKGDQVRLLHDLPSPLPMVMGDPLRVRQVLLNLYSNAAKFTDSGYIKLRVRAEQGEVVFAIEDTGTGIPETDRATIFQEFRQGTAGRKKGRQGAGLGLAISQQLLRLMNGRIWFDSTVGKGTTFYVALPEYVAPVEAQAAPAAAPAARLVLDQPEPVEPPAAVVPEAARESQPVAAAAPEAAVAAAVVETAR